MTQIPTLREEANRRAAWLIERLATVLPALMRECGIDAWVLAAREYNEDPVLATMLPPTWFNARRRTILAFTRYGEERASVSRYDAGPPFPGIWEPDAAADQWACLAAHLDTADPVRIAVNRSKDEPLADGLSAAEHDALVAALPERLRARLVEAAPLAVGWLETRIPAEMEAYRDACAVAHEMLAAALSAKAVTPSITTTADVEWWLRERVRDLGLAVWFHPTISVQRRDGPDRTSFASHPVATVIEPGDLVHVDFGIVYLGLHTDQQQHAYVLRAEESEAPAGLAAGLAAANRLQDLLLAEFAAGRTGNEVLVAAREAAADAGLRPSIYTHPIGVHGHAAGPTIGLWDAQENVPGVGDYRLRPNTAWSIELSATAAVPEWGGRDAAFMLEEEAYFDGTRIDWVNGRQTELHLI